MVSFRIIQDNDNLFRYDYYVVFKDEVGISIIYAGNIYECKRYVKFQKKRLKKYGNVYISKRVK